MPVTIGSNISSLRTVRTLDRTSSDLSSVSQRLSSGQRITRASDDAAGLAISSALNVKSQVFAQGIRNVNDGISLMAIAEGALGSLSDIVTRVGELATQAANGTFSAKPRIALDKEADTLLREYNRIIQSTSFNGMKILDGSEDVVTLQHGIGDEMVTRLEVGYQLGTAAGDGTFGAGVSFGAGGGAFDLSLADTNGDGIIDVVTADSGDGTVSVMLGNGNGTFQVRRSFDSGGTLSVATADMNGDGFVDIVSAGSNATSVLLGNGDGTFRGRTSFATGNNSRSVTLSDLNSDGSLDIITADYNSGTTSVLLGNGNGTFRGAISFETGASPRAVAVADMNGDGITDIVSAAWEPSVSILIGNGDGTFQVRRSFEAAGFPYSVALADMNDDGLNDIVTADLGGNTASVYLSNGDGTFRARRSFDATGASSVSIADMNGDSLADIVATNWSGSNFTVLLSNGDGTFSSRIEATTAAGGSYASAVTDTNGDGVLDIITANNSSSTTSVLLGNADSTGRRNNFVDAVDLLTIQGARQTLDWTKKQQTSISRELGMLGAYQSRLRTTLSVLDTTRINSMAAASRITDADVAAESADLVRLQILQQSGQSILAQANQSPQIALRLLQGV